MNFKKIISDKIFIAIFIFLTSVILYSYPFLNKGYPASADFVNLSKARNYALSGEYNMEGENGLFLSPNRLSESGKALAVSNPLTPIIYGNIFKYFGFGDSLLFWPTVLSIGAMSFFNVFIFLTISRIVDVKVGFISTILMLLMPTQVANVVHFGSHEFAMIFFSIALCLFFSSKTGTFKANRFRIFSASIFFALAALARNAFFISFVPFVLYDFYLNRSLKRSLVFVIPFLIIFGLTLTPYSWLNLPNGYTEADINNQSFSLLGEVFPDPYTAYFDRDVFIETLKNNGLDRSSSHFLKQWGYSVGTFDQFSAFSDSASFYIIELFDLRNFGGPIILFLGAIGVFWLYKNNREMLQFLGLWIFIWFFSLVYFETANRTHFLEIVFIVALLVGLGVNHLIQRVDRPDKIKLILIFILTLSIFGHLFYADKWRLFDAYRSSHIKSALELSQKVNSINNEGVVAAGVHPGFAYGLYYLTDKDTIYFSPETVKSLIERNKLKEAFGYYQVKTAVGFSKETSDSIKRLVDVEVIPLD